MSKTIGSLALVLVVTAIGTAQADLSKNVQKTFRGDILITDGPLPEVAGSDAQVIAAYKKARAKTLKHSKVEGVAEWSFDYTAFLKQAPKVTSLSVDFHTADKEKLYVANKGLMGVDPTLPILTGTLTITEDDGLNVGRTYLVKITGKVKGKEVTFAETTVTMK